MFPSRSCLWVFLTLALVQSCRYHPPPPPYRKSQVASCRWRPTNGAERIRLLVVYAKTKEPLIGVVVRIDSTNMTALSNVDGLATLSNLPPGTYDLTVSLDDFKTTRLTGVVVRDGFVTNTNVELHESRPLKQPINLYDGPDY